MNARVVLHVALVAAALAAPAAAQAQAVGGFPLGPGSSTVTLRANRVQCAIHSDGHVCADFAGSPVFGGGFWPRGTGDNYVFQGGLQVAALIAGTPSASFPWPGDTIGAFFMDLRGDQNHGQALTRIYDWLAPRDRSEWPAAARALDTSLFAPALLGREAVSDQDTWVRYTDVSRARNGRTHPAGLLVEQRTLAFDRPGLNDIVFFVFRLINITARDPARYQGLAASGYGPTEIAEIAALGAGFQDQMNGQYGIQIPDSGYAMDSLYVAFAQDPDVGDAGRNYANFNLVFDAALAYKSDFSEPRWQYPPDIFQPPFAQAPGFVGEAFLRTPRGAPAGSAIVFAGTPTGGGSYPDAIGTSSLWRKLSGHALPGEVFCNVANPQTRRFCWVSQFPSDAREFMTTGPTRLDPGQSAVLIVAHVQAAALQSAIAPYVGTGNGLTPGSPLDGARLAAGQDTVRTLDRAAGWISYADANANGVIEPGEVVTTPYSLYWKIQLAQAVVASKFLVPEPPDAPRFLLVQGDGRVTVWWQKSATEASGDPFFTVASNPLSPLYDPNYRRYDVEGYRIWRGTSASDLRVIAQFDYAGTQIQDYTGQFAGSSDAPTYGQQCAPELGVTSSCPTFPASVGLDGDVVQVPPGGRILLTSGAVAVLRADTAVTGGASGRAGLANTGVPLIFVDSTARNGQSYLYAVTAFDVNSVRSGPSTLESPLAPRAVTPRVASSAVTPGAATLTLTGRNSTVLDPGAPLPSIDATTGIFSGPMPPTNGVTIGGPFLPYVANGTLALTIDSIIPSYDCFALASGTCANGTYFVSVITPDSTFKKPLSFVVEGTTGPSSPAIYQYPPVPFLNALASRFGGDSSYALNEQATLSFPGAWRITSQGRAAANGFGGRFNGPRWWAGSANETLANPNGNVCSLPGSGCIDTVGYAFASAAGLATNTAGVLPNISVLYPIKAYLTTPNPTRDLEILTASVTRAADFRVYWGATAGKVDSVIDVTHNVSVPFSPHIRASWGILNDSSFTNTPAAGTPDGSTGFLTWTDVFCVDPVPAMLAQCGSVPQATAAFLMDHAISNAMNYKASALAGGPALVTQGTTGNGFIFYLNGTFFVMQMSSNLAACCQSTVWNARFYAGNITGAPGSFALQSSTRPPAVPGLKVAFSFTGSSFNTAASSDTLMQRIHTVPDPYYITNALETSGGPRILRFVNLPSEAIVRVYSASGILVAILSHNDQTGGGEEAWDLRARNGRIVASGVYFFHVEAPDGRTRVGRFTVVSSGN